MELSNALLVQDAVENGVWVDYDDETSFLIRSTECKEYVRAMQKNSRKLKGELAKSMTAARKVTMKCIVEAIIVDWKGITENGKKLACTPENVERVLQVPSVRDFIADQATEQANFQRESMSATADAVKKGS
tara:strand:+ start:18152 stop:18547 length:396 start_codon:yes stop_codon:yes gene_type:complete